MVRAVFWDFGGVITSSPFENFAECERTRGLPPGTIRSINAANPDTNAWARFERSEIDRDEFSRLFAAEAADLGLEIPGAVVLDCLLTEVRPTMVAAVAHVSAHYTTALLTNNFVPHGGGAEQSTPSPYTEVLPLFDVVVESSKVGVRKPDPAFYELACELAAVEPADVVFLDDLGINLKPARAMGMATIKVTDPGAALDELSAILGMELPR